MSQAVNNKTKTKTKRSDSSSSSKVDENQIKSEKYTTERVVGNGTFGVVFEAYCVENDEKVAIKKVLQDRRYKNRELQIMQMVKHPNVIEMKDCFFSRGNDKKRARDVYLNLVMEYVPETVYQTIRTHVRAKQTIPFLHAKLYAYQICRGIAYVHSLGVCHRDIKPQNLLLNPTTHIVKVCDFGSAKRLVRGQPNVAYICSRYYRAPELIFEATDYTTKIDVWSLGCVVAEIFLGEPLFQGGTSLDQLVQIIQVLGSPSKEDILAMNHNYTTFRFPHVKPLDWETVFQHVRYSDDVMPADAMDLISKMLIFDPDQRVCAFKALAHPFFDELRADGTTLKNGKPLPPLFNFEKPEIQQAQQLGIFEKIVPERLRSEMLAMVSDEGGADDAKTNE